MSAVSKIEWTDRTWNPVRGCSVVSPGCVNCYAMKQAHRFSGPGKAYEGLTKQTKAGPQWTGTIRTVDAALLEPLSWRTPARVFVNSMSDLFHDDVPDEFIDRVFAVMALSPSHTFQILTKRPSRMKRWSEVNSTGGHIFHVAQQIDPARHGARSGSWPLPNVWLGVSAEDQRRADERIGLLLQTSAAVRFISAEPLLEPVDIERWLRRMVVGGADELTDRMVEEGWSHPFGGGDHSPLDWVIVGGESGPGARACNLEWARSIVSQCREAGVACFVKQLGARPFIQYQVNGGTYTDPMYRALKDRKGGEWDEWPADLRVREFPRSAVRA